VIDREMGLYLQPKPITELDRLTFVVRQIQDLTAVPKSFLKYIPGNNQPQPNEAFRGLAKKEMMSLDNWHFTRSPKDPEIKGKIARGEATYSSDCRDKVSAEMPAGSWSIQEDVTGTVATLKSHLWPGLMSYHRCNSNIVGYCYMGDGICNQNLPFMV